MKTDSAIYPVPVWILTAGVYFVSLLLVLIDLWQFTIIVALIGGLFSGSVKKSMIAGSVGNGLAWLSHMLSYIIMYDAGAIITQVTQIITGLTNAGWVLIIIITLIAGILGLLGGFIGFHLDQLLFPATDELETDSPTP